EILGIASVPMNWPIGMGKNFQGLYDFTHGRVEVYQPEDGKRFVEFDENGEVPTRNASIIAQTRLTSADE
ncbi:hypothetical protein FDX20_29265, partial [Citrobacter sp. TBCS-11]